MNAIDDYIAKLYKETADFYAKIQPDLASAEHDFKYRILYGPPFPNPPILWIGYQPGGRKPDTGEQYVTWSGVVCDYAVENWTLAKRMRQMFSPKEILEKSVALNAIFVRSPNVAKYYAKVPPKIRDEIFKFCEPRIGGLIPLLNPKLVVMTVASRD